MSIKIIFKGSFSNHHIENYFGHNLMNLLKEIIYSFYGLFYDFLVSRPRYLICGSRLILKGGRLAFSTIITQNTVAFMHVSKKSVSQI
jgi:hypothetical protein